MKKLIVTLKQHTPIIFFQHNQPGATLRATDIKPRLDRFIIKKNKNNVQADWFIDGKGNGENKALRYKMKIALKENVITKEYLITSGNIKSNWLVKDMPEREASGDKKRIVLKNRGTSSVDSQSHSTHSIISDNINKVKASNIIIPDKLATISNSPFFAQEDVSFGHRVDKQYVFKEDPHQRTYFFIQNNWDQIDKKGLFWENPQKNQPSIEITITAFNDDLIDEISKQIQAFFVCHNFGTRSNKGFGSFTVASINGESGKPTDVQTLLEKNFDFVYQQERGDQDLYKSIKTDYQIIKSGQNYNGYIKSLLFCYGSSEMNPNYRWEKRRMKQKIKEALSQNTNLNLANLELKCNCEPKHDYKCKYKNSDECESKCKRMPISDNLGKQSWNDPEPYHYAFLRAMLGLPSHYDFLLQDREGKKTSDWKVEVKISTDKNKIERYQSPLLFKVINNQIYLVGNEPGDEMKNKQFTFEYEAVNNHQRRISLNIRDNKENYNRTPKEFSLCAFMHFAMKKNNGLNYTELKNKQTEQNQP